MKHTYKSGCEEKTGVKSQTKNRDGSRSETAFRITAIVLILAAAAIAFAGSLGYDMAKMPDEIMRYEIAEFIYDHGSLPWGDEPELITAYGFNYSFAPYLPTIIGTLFMKIAGLFSADPLILAAAFRQVSVLSLAGTGVYAFLIAKRAFRSYGTRVLFVAITLFWPQVLFLGSYFNNDIVTVFLGYGFVYCWLRARDEGWSWPLCIQLGLLCGVLSITYYFAYAYLPASILVFCLCGWKKGRMKKEFWLKFLTVFLIAFAVGGWWFIKNALFMPGDFLGFKATEYYQITYGIPEVQNNATINCMSFWDMLFKPHPMTGTIWWQTFLKSYIGLFGSMNIVMHPKYYVFYCLFTAAGLIPGVYCAIRLFQRCPKMRALLAALAFCLVVPAILSAVNSYINDYQPQGRYMISNLCPLMLLVCRGYAWLSGKCNLLLGRISMRLSGRKICLLSLSLLAAIVMTYKGAQLYIVHNRTLILERAPEILDGSVSAGRS